MTPELEKQYKDRIIARLRQADTEASRSFAGEGNYQSQLPANLESMSLAELMKLSGSMASSVGGGADSAGWSNADGLFTLDPNDEAAQAFRSQFGTGQFGNVELNNKALGNNLRFSYDKPSWFDEGAQDKTRIMQLPDGRWVWEENNLSGDYVKNKQAESADSGFFHGDPMDVLKVAALFAGAQGLAGLAGGAGAADAGALGLDALEGYTATTPGWQEAIAGALEPAGAIPEATIPDLMDPLNPTSIPDIQTPSLDVPVDTPSGWEGLGPGDGMSPPEDPFTNWLDNYLSDSGSTTQLPFGEDAYTSLGIDPNAVSAAGTFEGMSSPTWYESLFDTAKGLGSSFVNKLPALAGALKGAIPQGGAGGRSPGLGGVGGGGGGFGGGGSGRGLAADAFEAERLKQIKSLAEYLGSLK